MTKHTPGPWAVQDGFLTVYACSEGESGITIVIAKALDTQLKMDFGADAGQHEAIANARLIAAAPDLLEALRATTINGHYNECLAGQRGHGECSLVCRWVRAAIAKAEGTDQ